MVTVELIVTSFLAIALLASFFSQRTRTPYTLTLGVAFVTIVLQGPLLMRYASRNFRKGEPH